MKKCIFGNYPIGKHGLISLFWSVFMYKKIFSVIKLTSYQFSLVRGFSGRGGMLSRFRFHALTRPFSSYFRPFLFWGLFWGLSVALWVVLLSVGWVVGSLGVVGVVGCCGRSV